MIVQLDARSQLAGSACLLFCKDEEGQQMVGRWQGSGAAAWKNIIISGDSVWIHLRGEVPSRLAKSLWGFRVRLAAQAWKLPELESEALEAPLPIGWHLLDLLSKHRPVELLTSQTYFFMARYLNATDAPHHALAAGLLLRLLKLAKEELPDGTADPRDSWPMEQLLQLEKHVEWHASNARDPISGLLPLRIQLFCEVVAQAWLRLRARNESPLLSRPWLDGVVELAAAANFFLGGTEREPLEHLPRVWLAKLQDAGMDVLQIHVGWNLSLYPPLIKYARRIVGPKGELLKMAPGELAQAEKGPLAGCSTASLRLHFALLQEFNHGAPLASPASCYLLPYQPCRIFMHHIPPHCQVPSVA